MKENEVTAIVKEKTDAIKNASRLYLGWGLSMGGNDEEKEI